MPLIGQQGLHESYDYIVCGGGTSGPVVAARLAEDPDVKVLMIEAGTDSTNMENVQMTGGWSKNFDSPADWNIVTEPSAGANNRQINASRGKFIGGCSGCNGTLCVRGTRQDYDSWNVENWSGDEMWRCMSKAETFHSKPWFKPDASAHGTNGPVHTEPMDLAPISNLMLDSMQSQGFPLHHDMFSSGNVSHGCGHAVRTVFSGTRTTGADYVRKTPSNLHVMPETLVDKVNFQGSGSELRATGVNVITKEGETRTIRVQKEVVVSGGTYCSPLILMRSGLGDKAELSKHGIECRVDLPGVGKNLQDHLITFIFYEVSEAGLTTDHLLYHGDSLAESYRQWKEERRGALASFPFGAFAFSRLDDRLKDDPVWNSAPREQGKDPMGLTPAQPNIEFFTTECYGGPKQYADFPIDQKHTFSIIAELFSPRSRGTVSLASADPKANPIVDHNYLSDPLDITVLSEACALGNEIVTKGRGTKDILKGSWPADLTHHMYTHRDEWKPFVRDNATTCYHPGGTCKMGDSGDKTTVVDSRLRVHGVKGLRVADVSIMPTLNQGHTQMPAYGIGERAAELIKEDSGLIAVPMAKVHFKGSENVEVQGASGGTVAA